MATIWTLASLLATLTGSQKMLASASVETTLSAECREFFHLGIPPIGLEDHSLKKICQRFNHKARYVTLYDSIDHVPVYSAYIFHRSDGKKMMDIPWMFEPQLSTASETDEMQPFPLGYVHQSFEDVQAVLEDYSDVVDYERGLLNPDEHHAEPDDKAATYTLTNVVPQMREFNNGPWKEQEHLVRQRLNNYCRGKAHIITGITTSGNMIRRHNIDRLAIPTYMWSAYCCMYYDHNAPYEQRYKFPSFAHYGLNDKKNNQIIELTVKKLEEFLKSSTYVDKNFQIFVDDCIPPLP